MRDSRAICLLCRARQSVQAATRRGALFDGGNNNIRGRWHSTAAAADSTGPADASTSTSDSISATNSTQNEGQSSVIIREETTGPRRRQPISRMQTSSIQRGPPSRVIRHRASEVAALAVFRDIVENQNRAEERQPKRKQPAEAETAAEGEGDLDQLAHELGQAHLQKKIEQLQQQQQQQPSAGRESTASIDLYNHLVKLTQLRSHSDSTIATLFHHFETNMYPHMTENSRELPNIFRQAAHQLVREVSAAKLANFQANDLPSVARITQIRRQLDLLNKPAPWVPLILGLAAEIVQLTNSIKKSSVGESVDGSNVDASPDSSDSSTSARAKRTALVGDLVEAWRMFNLPDIVVADEEALKNTPVTEFRMPKPDPARLEKYTMRRNIQRGLALLFPRYAPEQLRELTPAVLATYAILADPSICTPGNTERAHEFMHSVTEILAIASLRRRTVPDMYESHPDLGSYILTRWPLVGGPGENQSQAQQQPWPTARSSKDARRATLESIHKQLDQALLVRNIQACEAAWDRFWSAVSVPDVEGPERLRGSGDMLDYFIMAFTTLRMSDRAIAVWNLMTMAGIKPTLRTWTSFIEGFKGANNPAGIHNIWERLVASGIQVDTAVWTARISGLIQSGDTEAGMQALDEMQRLWEASQQEEKLAATLRQKVIGNSSSSSSSTDDSKKDGKDLKTSKESRPQSKAIKPTIEPVNAAIAGMLRRGDMAAAKKVLAWAGRHGIEPDIITFNTILRPLVRDGAADEVAGLLDMMRQRSIRPDEATITILLDDTIGGDAMAGRSPEERAEVVKRVLADVEASGLDANQQNYAKIIYLLLQDDQADAAVSVVFKRMRQRNIPMSSHIYTILAEEYFMRNPPDLDAVRYLIEHGQPGVPARQTSPYKASSESEKGVPVRAESVSVSTSDVASPVESEAADLDSDSPPVTHTPPTFDRVFWERVVRGFAQVGDTASAQKYFAHIADSVSVTSSTLEDLLRALISNNEWDAAAQLVAKVQAQKTIQVQSGVGGETARLVDARQFRHRFWHLANQHGLLKEQQ
ncbi:hypothetical protein Sste5346_001765 [Sporothrix stenoceras]|uniref:Pentatricopeptide repeat protein n=1 Tax=Sporothrix stenoceras TaxID=5173 RepID=A0ABR3ZKZ2_9PEZI